MSFGFFNGLPGGARPPDGVERHAVKKRDRSPRSALRTQSPSMRRQPDARTEPPAVVPQLAPGPDQRGRNSKGVAVYPCPGRA